MNTTKTLAVGVVAAAIFAAGHSVWADDLAAAAARASAFAKRPIAASPHALEDFPWAFQGDPPPTRTTGPVQTARVYPDDLASAAAEASAQAMRPVAASPHALEDFPWALRGYQPPAKAASPAPNANDYPDDLATAAARASALVKRPIAASPHALENFTWLLQGYAVQTNPSPGLTIADQSNDAKKMRERKNLADNKPTP